VPQDAVRWQRLRSAAAKPPVTTIVSVARRAGVSPSTVSHVVNGTRRVAPETARLVQEAIALTGYTPNTIARALKRAATSSVGVAISAITNPYFSDIICAIENECSRIGLMVFLADTHDDPDRELGAVKALHQRRVDGIILAPSAHSEDKALKYLEERAIPCVLVDRLASRRFDQVGVWNKQAMEQLVAHLVGHGHRRIGLVAGQPGFATTLERIDGFRSGLRRHGLPLDEDLVPPGNQNVAAAGAACRALLALADPPTALVTGNNLATIGAMRAIRAAGLKVPADLALVGFDDFEWADSFEPRLTVISQPCEEIGRRAAGLLVDRIAQSDAPRRTIRLKPTLVVRNSCGCVDAGPHA
jgi:LacI family transcriptional regulator